MKFRGFNMIMLHPARPSRLPIYRHAGRRFAGTPGVAYHAAPFGPRHATGRSGNDRVRI
jgi:hypothetical protein